MRMYSHYTDSGGETATNSRQRAVLSWTYVGPGPAGPALVPALSVRGLADGAGMGTGSGMSFLKTFGRSRLRKRRWC